MAANSAELYFNITNVHATISSFPIARSLFTPDGDRLFYVSASDGRTTKKSVAVKLDGHALHWCDTLEGFRVLDSSSRLTLEVFENHGDIYQEFLATFFLSYHQIRSSQHDFLLQTVDNTNIFPPRKISITLSDRFDSFLRACIEVERVRNPSGWAKTIVGTLDKVGESINASRQMAPAMNGFSEKRRVVLNCILFVTNALETIAEVRPYIRQACTVISSIPSEISGQIPFDNNVRDLLDSIEQALHLAPNTQRLEADKLKSLCEHSADRRKTIIRMMDLIAECGYFIQCYLKDPKFSDRVNNIASKGKTPVASFQEGLKQLRDAFIDETVVDVDTNILRILGQVEFITDRLEDHDLDTKFPFVQGARFNPEKGCLPGTRLKFLRRFEKWLNNVDPSLPKALLLLGQAGTGKSSIAHEIAHRFHCVDRLITSYCFVRGNPSSREPHRFFTTLARCLSARYPAFKASLGRVIKKNPDLLSAVDYTTLFKSLILEPLKGLQFISPVLIMIDALDECEDASTKLRTGIAFHTFLGQHVSELPSNFRLLMTSRPEVDILDALPESSSVRHVQMDDPCLADGVGHEIRTYMQTKLARTNVGSNDLDELAEKAEGLFQWASVACDYIGNPPRALSSKDCIDRVLRPTGSRATLNPLDTLYKTVLEGYDIDDPEVLTRFQFIMGQIFASFEPLSIASLNNLCQYVSGVRVHDVIKHLASLLSNVTSSDSNLLIEPLHSSFHDFLTDPNRSGKFYVNLDNAHGQLAYATLRTMQEMLHFNICRLETSCRLNSEVQDLDDRIEKRISLALRYSCLFWAKHLGHVSEFNLEIFLCLRTLMQEKFLFWLEVLSVVGRMDVASAAMLSLRAWLGQMRNNAENKEINTLDEFVKDAIAFVQYFGYAMAQSAPHIYLSALPFAPSSSVVSKAYLAQFPNTIGLVSGGLVEWPPLQMAFYTKCDVFCVAYSKDGAYIAAGGNFGHLIIWNQLTGIKICESDELYDDLSIGDEDDDLSIGDEDDDPSIGDDDDLSIDDEDEEADLPPFISSVAFSDDNQYLASGSETGKILIWEVATGNLGMVLRDFEEYAGPVSALSFSQNSRQLASGSYTVLIWDLEEGDVVAGPFSGHENPVWAVAFLPDKKHLVSYSGFYTARIWNMKTGQAVQEFQDMEIPAGSIKSTVHYYDGLFLRRDVRHARSNFSPCLWPEEEYKPAEEDTYFWIQAVAISPDGKLIATGSQHYIQVWHAVGRSAGMLAGGPFSNNDTVCLAFSADGKQVVSASGYGLVRVWNVRKVDVDEVQVVGEPSGRPSSVALCPNSEQVVVARQDGMVQILDVLTGQEVVKVKEGEKVGLSGVYVTITIKGDCIATTRDEEIHVLTQLVTGEIVTVAKHLNDHRISVVTFFPDSNNILAFGTYGGTVAVFDVSTSAFITEPKQISNDAVRCLALASRSDNPTRTRIAISAADQVFIWDIDSGVVTCPYTGSAIAIAFSSIDSRYVTSFGLDKSDSRVSRWDYTFCVFDSMTGHVMGLVSLRDDQKMRTPPERPLSIAPDGQTMVCKGEENTALVFKVLYKGDGDMALLGPWVLAGHVGFVKSHMAFSKDSRFVTTTSVDRTIRIWDIQAAGEEVFVNAGSEKSDHRITSLDGVMIDEDGWAYRTRDELGKPFRLMWIPEMHRSTLSRPNMRIVGVQKETRLDFSNFVYGRDWIKCKA